MTVLIRPATAQDLEGLSSLFVELFTAMAAGRPDLFRAPDGSDPDERARLAAYCTELLASADDKLFVAVSGDDVLGLIHVWLRRVPESPTVPFRRACIEGWIQHIVVAQRSQQRGVGRALDQEGRAWARAQGAETVGLQVWASNERGKKFFARLGYTPRSLHLYDR